VLQTLQTNNKGNFVFLFTQLLLERKGRMEGAFIVLGIHYGVDTYLHAFGD
jgi:hypothetical protein